MRINSIGVSNFGFAPKAIYKSDESQKLNFGFQSNPIGHSLAADQVSFTGKPISPFFLKAFHKIPCPCCGVEMLNFEVMHKFDESFLSKTSDVVVEALSKYEKNMRPTERTCFKEIKALSLKNPKRKLNELVMSVRNKHLQELKKTEIKVLDELDEVAKKKLSKNSAKFLTDITKESRKILQNEGNNQVFKRKNLLRDVTDLKSDIPEKEVAEELLKIAQKLPSSGDDVNAFMVKYAERGPKEIGQRLLSPSLGTVEHVHPRSLGGASSDYNYILECAGCNNPRGNQLFHEFVADNPNMVHNIPEGTDLGGLSTEQWVKLHPEHKGNVQKSMDVVIGLINEGKIEGYDWYPATIAKTLEKESKGAIKLDLSELKVSAEAQKEPDVLEQLADKLNTVNRNPVVKNKTAKGDNVTELNPGGERVKKNKKKHKHNRQEETPSATTNPFASAQNGERVKKKLVLKKDLHKEGTNDSSLNGKPEGAKKNDVKNSSPFFLDVFKKKA